MIVLDKVTKTISSQYGRPRVVLSSVSLHIPSNRRIAFFSTSPVDVPILINLLAGLILPNSGQVIRRTSVSFPVGHLGGFDLQLTVRENAAYVARLYGAESAAVIEFVRDVSGIDGAFDRPFGQLTGADIKRVSHIIAYSIPFDLYLHLTDFTSPGQRTVLGAKALELTEARSASCGMVVPSRNLEHACKFFEVALILHQGRLFLAQDIREAPYLLWQMSETNRMRDSISNVSTLKKIFGKGF